MADIKVIGAVAVKVRPDTDGFRERTKAKILDELKNFEVDAKINVDLDDKDMATQVEKARKRVEKKMTLSWQANYDSIDQAVKQVEKKLADLKATKLDVEVNKDSLEAAQGLLEKIRGASSVKMNIIEDKAGYKQVLARIEALRKEKLLKEITFKTDEASLSEAASKYQDLIRQEGVEIDITADAKGFQSALDLVNKELEKFNTRKFRVELDEDALLAERDHLEKVLAAEPIVMQVTEDAKGYQQVLDKIHALQAEQLNKTVTFQADEGSLDDTAAAYEQMLADLVRQDGISLDITPDTKGFKKALAAIDAELDKFETRKFQIELDEDSLRAERERLDQIISSEPVEMKVDWGSKASIEAARRELEGKLSDLQAVVMEVDPDEASIQEAIKQFNDAIAEIESNEVDMTAVAHTSAAAAQMRYTTRPRFIDIYARINKRSLALVEGAIQSLAGIGVLRSLGKSLENVAINFDKVAIKSSLISAGLAGIVNTLSYAATAMLSIGEGMLQSVGILATAPAALASIASLVAINIAAFEDFGEAIDGNAEAMARLPEEAQRAATALQGFWDKIQEPVQNSFWNGMGDSMRDMVNEFLFPLRHGLTETAQFVGEFAAGAADSFAELARSGALSTMFEGLEAGMKNAAAAARPFFDALNTLGLRGSEHLPQFGQWLTDIANQFNDWVQAANDAGDINRWIEQGVESLQDMGRAGSGIVDMFRGLTRAANAAGQQGLGVFADNLQAIGDMMMREPFQSRMTTIFEGANEGASELNVGLQELGETIGEASEFVATLLTKLGTLGGGVLSGLAKTLGEVKFQEGILDSVSGMNELVRDLGPTFEAVGRIIGTFGSIAADVFRNLGPTINTVFGALDDSMATLGPALEKLAPALADMLNGLATVLTGPLVGGIELLSAAIEGLAEAPPIIRDLVLAFGGLAALRMGGFFTSITTGIAGLVKGSPKLTGALGGITRFLGGPWGLALGVTSIAALAAFGEAQANAKARVDALRDSLDAQTGALTGNSIELAMDQLDRGVEGFEGAMLGIGEALGFEIPKVSELMGDFGLTLKDTARIATEGGPAYERLVGQIKTLSQADAGPAAAKAAKELADKLNLTDAAALDFARDGGTLVLQRLKELRGETKQGKNEWTDYYGAAEKAGKTVEQVAKQFDIDPTQVGELADAMGTLSNHAGDATGRVNALKQAIDILNGKAPSAEEALGNVEETMDNLGTVFKDAEGNYYDFTNAIGENGKISQATEASRGLYDSVNGLGDEMLNAAVGMDAAGASSGEIAGKLSAMQTEFARNGEAAGLSAAQVEAAFNRYINATPEEIAIMLDMNINPLEDKALLADNVLAKYEAAKAVAELGGDDAELGVALATSYDNLSEWDKAVAKATIGLDDSEAQAVKTQLEQDLIRLAMSDPTVMANMDPRLFEREEQRILDQIKVLDGKKASPIVDAQTQEARDRLAEIRRILGEFENKSWQAKAKLSADADAFFRIKAQAEKEGVEFTRKYYESHLDAEKSGFDKEKAAAQAAGKNFSMMNFQSNLSANKGPFDRTRAAAITAGQAFGRNDWIAVLNGNNKPFERERALAILSGQNFGSRTFTATGDLFTDPFDRGISDAFNTGNGFDLENFVATASVQDNATTKLQGIMNLLRGVDNSNVSASATMTYETHGTPFRNAPKSANGNLFDGNFRAQKFADGGITHEKGGRAKIYSPATKFRIHSEPETKGESYIPLAASKRVRSEQILGETARRFGGSYVKNSTTTAYANGGISGGTATAAVDSVALSAGLREGLRGANFSFALGGRELYTTIKSLDAEYGARK